MDKESLEGIDICPDCWYPLNNCHCLELLEEDLLKETQNKKDRVVSKYKPSRRGKG